MAKGPTVEERLAGLNALRTVPDAAERRKGLAEGLASRSNLVAAKAASLVAELRVTDLNDELARAFERFIGAGDKGCAATAAIAAALNALGAAAEPVFL